MTDFMMAVATTATFPDFHFDTSASLFTTIFWAFSVKQTSQLVAIVDSILL